MQIPTLSLLLELPSLVITTCNQYSTCAHGISAIIGVHVQAPELASAVQLSSGGSYSAVLQTEDGNGGSGGVERSHCQW